MNHIIFYLILKLIIITLIKTHLMFKILYNLRVKNKNLIFIKSKISGIKND